MGIKQAIRLFINPWSIINYIKNKEKLSSYWVNISENALLETCYLNPTHRLQSAV